MVTTTSKLLYDLLKNNKMDVRLTGNIGYPILMEKKIKKNTIFVIEALHINLIIVSILSQNILLYLT